MGAFQQQSKQNRKEERSSHVHRSSHSHSHCCCYSLSSGPHRHATLTSTHAPPAQASGLSCAPAAPQRPPPPPSVQTAPCPPRPSQSPACPGHAQHTQRHNVVPPLLHNHERNAQRVLAHVLHVLQAHADQVGRHALHLVVVLLVLGADPPTSSQSTAWTLRETAKRCHFSRRRKRAETTDTLTPSHISSPSTLLQTRAHAEAPPSTSHCNGEPCAQHTHGRNKRDGTYPPLRRSPLLPSAPTDWRPTLTVRHSAHHLLPYNCAQQAGAQSPSCHRNGEHKQSSSRTIGASSGK
ncbi:hypothetical protein MOQ_006911 [Trypanosoma cruzi marinkellei]|uniref:Uncharacterized protein n=1 Tax=Trypanosoma cruzi marinkellei TaxID=85056 RepID=K2NK57_TRYCR|nr:hypothetical protein MOQ_006911 [Trypanosoma cruzi marinkellei]